MRTRRRLGVAVLGLVALALLAGGAGTARADFIFDPDGPGSPNPATLLAGFNPAPGNILGQNLVTAANNFVAGAGPTTFQMYYQSQMSSLLKSSAIGGGSFNPNVGGSVMGTPGTPGATFQLTIVSSVTEQITSVNLATNTVKFQVALAQSPNSFLQMWFGTGATFNSDNLAGTGFKNGTLILTATPMASAAGTGQGQNNGTTALYDQFGPDNYGGKQSVVGSGSSTVDFNVTSVNNGWFVSGAPSVLSLEFTTALSVPFKLVDPSMLFQGLTGPSPGAGDVVPNLGAINGISGPDLQFQSATSSFGVPQATAVPEPSTLALLTVGGLGMAGWRRWKRRRSPIHPAV
jgi:hypothetical protein